MPRRKVKLLIFLTYLIFLLACSISQKKKNAPYRLIDHLDQKNVISSPFIGLHQKFDRINQQWSGKKFRLFRIQKQKYYAISTRLPVLGWEGKGKPQMMKITVGGKEIPFQEDSFPDELSWSLKKGEFETAEFKKNKQKTKVLFLNEKETLKKLIFLPEGKFILEIWAESTDPSVHFPRLKITLNKNPLGEIIIGPYKCYKITGQAKLGWNVFVFSHEQAGMTQEQSERGLNIDKISIKSFKDIILFTIEENKKEFLNSEYSAVYLAEPIDKIFKIEKKLESSQSYTQEIEIDSSGKRKIEVIGYSPDLNSVLKVKLNDQKIYEGKFTSFCQNILSIEKLIDKGKHNIKLEYLSPHKGAKSLYLQDIIIENLERKIYLLLAKIKNVSLIQDLSIGKNPFGLKKKFVILDFSKRKTPFITHNAINTIFAPPLTHLEFALKIPQAATLEFGYGFLEKSWKEKNRGIDFKIIVQDSQNKEIIFSRRLNPYQSESHRKLFYQRIDLSKYFNKKVKLRFITTSPSYEKETSVENFPWGKEYAYWYNPVIYVPFDKRKTTEPEFNIILISLDTLRADHLKCYDYERETSPNTDRLATEGVLCTNAFSSTNWTLPAHVSLLTSLENRHHRVNKANPYMGNSIITLADILRENGYFTCGFTGGALLSQRFGFSKGFDFYREFKGSQQQRNSAGILYNNFNNWINRNKDKKFFLFLHTYQNHEPYFSPPPYNSLFFNNKKVNLEKANMQKILFNNEPRSLKKFNDVTQSEKENIVDLYDGEIRYTDECLIKPLIEKLKKLNLYQRTMIIVTSDHGEEFLDHGAWLHGHYLYDELIRIPLIIKFAFSKFKNLKIDKPVRIIDIMPTILEEAGIRYSSFEFDGESLTRIIQNDKKEERLCIADVGPRKYSLQMASKIAIISDEYKLILNNDFGLPPQNFFPTSPPMAKIELYDKKKDPQEKKNIAHQEKEMVQYLLQKIYKLHRVEAGKKQTTEKEKDKGMDRELEETLRALGYIR